MQVSAGFAINYVLDVGEYGYRKSDIDNRAVITSMSFIPMKIGMALGGSLGLYVLAAFGFNEVAAGAPVTPQFLSSFMFLMGGLNGIVAAIGVVFRRFLYKITDKDAAKYARENAERAFAAE
jgi:Na+/melibiose symporter-like transporter